jgi:para-aminobenzoate synthetase/4-amino-4-deoxychorismate lyase
MIELDGRVVTPPVTCGLLAGTCRAEFLALGEATEAVVTLDDLRRATAIWVTHAVQGQRCASLLHD